FGKTLDSGAADRGFVERVRITTDDFGDAAPSAVHPLGTERRGDGTHVLIEITDGDQRSNDQDSDGESEIRNAASERFKRDAGTEALGKKQHHGRNNGGGA